MGASGCEFKSRRSDQLVKRRSLIIPYIYKISNNINNKIYIGKTLENIQKRWKEHLNDYKKDKYEKRPLYLAMKKYGVEHFEIELIEECSEDILSERETYWIQYFGSFKYGYNATIGGDGKPYLDYEHIFKTYTLCNSIKETAKLCSCTIDSVRKVLIIFNVDLSIRMSNRVKQLKKSVVMLDKTTLQPIRTFSSLSEAFKYLNKRDSGHITDVCSGKRRTAYGYVWKYL